MLCNKKTIIAIGSNSFPGNFKPEQQVYRAISLMGRDKLSVTHVSSLYKSSPLENKPQGYYVNCVVLINTYKKPYSLLSALKQIEKIMGRRPGEKRWGDRIIDLDIISYKGLVRDWSNPQKIRHTKKGALILPHPQSHLREFVMQPLAELLPFWRHPVLKITASDLVKMQKRQNNCDGGEIIKIYQ